MNLVEPTVQFTQQSAMKVRQFKYIRIQFFTLKSNLIFVSSACFQRIYTSTRYPQTVSFLVRAVPQPSSLVISLFQSVVFVEIVCEHNRPPRGLDSTLCADVAIEMEVPFANNNRNMYCACLTVKPVVLFVGFSQLLSEPDLKTLCKDLFILFLLLKIEACTKP